MNKGSDFGHQFQAESSAELVQKHIVMVGNARASKRIKECTSTQEPKKSSTLNQGKNQQPIGSIQKQPIGHSPTIGIDGGSIQNLDQRKQSLDIEGVSVQVTGSMPVQSKRQYQRKQSLKNRAATRNIETTQVSPQMDLAKSITVVQSEPPKKMNGQSKEFCHSKNHKRQLISAVGNPWQGIMEEEQASKKKKYIPNCPAMTLDEYVDNNKQQLEEEETEDESREENSQEPGIEGDNNYESEEVEEINENTSKGAVSKGKRGKTLCTNIHTRSPDYREEITLNEEGQPIGPNERIVSQLSSFLGTVARRSDLCPLTYTNWKAVPEKDKNIWSYVNEKYIIPEEGKKVVYAIINDAWRRYKCSIKKKHYSKYKNLHERLKNRPKDIPEEHFRLLMEYWALEAVQEISLKNAKNTAQQKRRHRAGPISFARIRARMCAREEDREPPQAKMSVATRQSKKGKESYQETHDAVIKFQNIMASSGQSSSEDFQNILSKEKPKRLHCQGRKATVSLLKRNEEIAEIQRAHASEMKQLKGEHAIEVKQLKDQVQGMEEKFQLLIKTMLNQNNSEPNLEALAALLPTPSDANSALHSSTRAHALDKHELIARKESPAFNYEILGKAKWDSISTKMLLAICMDEIRRSGKSRFGFGNKKWEEICEEFHKRANKNYTEKQLKNRLDNLRVDWTIWKQLMSNETSLEYNHQTGTIEADAAWWDAKIRENPKYAKFRYKGLEFCEQLEFIFGKTVVTNETQWTPAMGEPTESSGKNTASDLPHEIIESDDEDSPMESTQSRKKRKAPQDMRDESTKGKGKVRTAMSMRKTSEQLVQATGCHNEVGKIEVAATSHVYGECSIPDCVKVLKSAKEKGLLNGREFSYALEMLRDDQTRALLMSLTDSMDALVEWILYKYVSEGKL